MSLMSDIGAAIKNKLMVNDFASQSSNLLTGGGTVSVSATWEVKWSARFMTISNGRGTGLATAGHFSIFMPADATVITGVGGATNKTVTANGIPIANWESLYYILPVGGAEATVNANFRVVSYTADVTIPSTWIKICSRNNDGSYIDFACGVSLRNNTSINTNLYDVKGADVDGAVSSASTLATTRTFSATGDVTATAQNFNGSQNVALPMVLANSGVTAGTYSKVTVDAKGRVTAGVIPTMEDIPSASYKRSVNAATTANITLSAPQTIDGIALVAGDRVLVKNQTTASQNGIYIVNASTWTRSLDADTSDEIAGGVVNVDSGTINGGILYTTNFKTTDTLGTTSMNWYKVLDDSLLLTSTSALVGAVKYNGTVAANGNFDGGTTTPTGSARLNYGGYFYPTQINLTGSADTATASTHVFVETGSDGFVRPKTLSNFKTEMFTSPALTGTPTAPTPAIGNNTTEIATTNFVNKRIGNGAMLELVTASKILTINDIGKTFLLISGSNITLTLPSSTSLPNGSMFTILTSSSAVGSFSGVDVIDNNGNFVTNINQNYNYILYARSDSEQYRCATTSSFSGSSLVKLALNGYQKLPSGLIIQWGFGNAGQNGASYTNNFPITFPTACVSVTANHEGASDMNISVFSNSLQPSSFGAVGFYAASAISIRYIAIGY